VMGCHYTRAQPMQPTFTTRPDIRGTFGAVATTHWLATQTGMAVLERGGNAFDAAVAAGFVLQIVEPHLNGPGGELPAIVLRIGATIIPAVDYFKTEWPSSGEVWLVNGKAPHPDKPFRTPAIAEMYKRILTEAEAAGGDRVRQIEAARHAYYNGFVAEAIDRF